ncbi:protein DDI1 homolog 2-like isoform X1 [Homalodisca vitripennis]|nr:LOW QUALITY PROTEIN: protein DDI1 homolog 2-like [Homalodisca vitripennis]XP_046669768.1 protein DDI1 homolog 2-like isoform X1 [Homalodisca vitripennis]
MKVTVTTLSGDLFVLDVGEDLELENFKAFCELESGFPAPEISIVHNGRPLIDNKKSMKNHGVKDGDVVVLQHIASGSHNNRPMSFNAPDQGPLTGLDFSSIQVPGAAMSPTSGRAGPAGITPRMDDPAYVRDLFMANPDQLALLKQNNPRLADALATGRLEVFANVMREQMKERERRQEQRLRMMNAHPFDTEAQRLIAEEIKQKNIEANMEAAMEYNPETFGTVVMLYINCKVNGYPVKAFIDSGAQTTIMSAACAERVNIMRLVDTRWAGIAKGVGVQRIIGRIHMVQVAIENDYLTTSFSVLEEQPMDMLLGLDMLKRHQCCIDLKKNVLRIGTTGTETHFLSERDLPDCARLTSNADDEVMETIEDKDIQKAILASRQTNPSGASTSQLNPSTSVLESDRFGEPEVKELVNLGFTREQVIAELRRFNGDKKQATAALFAKSLKF